MRNLALLAFMTLALVLGACGADAPVAGVYVAEAPAQPAGAQDREPNEITLELKPGGEGALVTRTDSAPLKWDVRDNTVTLHGKSGGVMVGAVTRDGLTVQFPGIGALLFVRMEK